jgi:hypothetical protein
LRCNNRDPLLKGLIACGPQMADELLAKLNIQAEQPTRS